MSDPTVLADAPVASAEVHAKSPEVSVADSTQQQTSSNAEPSNTTIKDKENQENKENKETDLKEEGKAASPDEAPKQEKQNNAPGNQRKGKPTTWNNNNNSNNRRPDASTRGTAADRREPRRKKDFALETQAWPSLSETKVGQVPKSTGVPQTKDARVPPQGGARKPKDDGKKKKVVSWVPFKDVGPANPRQQQNKFNNNNNPTPPGQPVQVGPNPNSAPFTPAGLAAVPVGATAASPVPTASPTPSVQTTTTTTTTTQSTLNPNTANFFPNHNRQKRPYNNNNNARGNYRGRPNNNRRGGGGMGRYPTQFPEPFYGGQFRFYPPNFVAEPLEGETLREAIRKQIDYYFSVDNLCKDIYLRSKMDKEGYVAIDLIAAFNKVKYLVKDRSILIDALSSSSVVELDLERQLIRKRGDWNLWLTSDGSVTPDSASESDNENAKDVVDGREEDEKIAKGENDATAKAGNAVATGEKEEAEKGKVTEEGPGREEQQAIKAAALVNSHNEVVGNSFSGSSNPSSNNASQDANKSLGMNGVEHRQKSHAKDKTEDLGCHSEMASEISTTLNGVKGEVL